MDNHIQVMDLLNEQKNNLAQLSNALNSELAAISSRNADNLTESSVSKLEILKKVQSVDKRLAHLGLGELIQLSAEIDELVKEVKAQLAVCQKQNDINAHAAHQTHVAVNKVKEILLGSKQSLTYDKKGATAGNSMLGKGIKA